MIGVVGVVGSLAPNTADAKAGPLHIHELGGRVGKYVYGADRNLLAVRLRARVCFRGAREALNAYPTEIGVTHYTVSRGTPRRWRVLRTVVDRPGWLVPFGETWRGEACGSVWVDDPIPPTHYGAHGLGNPNACYGARLTIFVAGVGRTSKRAVIQCPFGRR